MATKTRAVTVTTTATRLDTTDETDSVSGSSLVVYNNGSATVYVGGSDVTTANGLPVAASAWGPGVDLDPGEAWYGIVASGTVEVRVGEQGI